MLVPCPTPRDWFPREDLALPRPRVFTGVQLLNERRFDVRLVSQTTARFLQLYTKRRIGCLPRCIVGNLMKRRTHFIRRRLTLDVGRRNLKRDVTRMVPQFIEKVLNLSESNVNRRQGRINRPPVKNLRLKGDKKGSFTITTVIRVGSGSNKFIMFRKLL